MSPAVAVAVDGWCDPAELFATLPADSASFWLDAGVGAREGWSWIGEGEDAEGDEVRDADCSRGRDGDRETGPFLGGWVGWFGYEQGAALVEAPTHGDADAAPKQMWMRTGSFFAFDHRHRRVWAIARDAEQAQTLADRATSLAAGSAASRPDRSPDADVVDVEASGRHAPEEYARLIEQCREHIRNGDAYQLCLTTRFDVPGHHDALEVYRRLRSSSSAHHGGIIRRDGMALLSASPERFLEVSDGVVRTHPIKGTRPRGNDPRRDVELADELRADPKEQAENVMIVDLMRNDLSRVCVPSSVTVERLLEVESYPTVHQLVSTVSGVLRPGTTVGDLLQAAFPAGSMTGAPKLSAMTILHSLERGPRGVYSGCFGWVGLDGAMDLAMVIRSIVVHPEGAYVGAGGGITWRSRPAAEVAEVGIKARAPLAALGAVLPAGW